METKHCRKCGEMKSVEEFNRSSRNKSGRQDWCRSCTKERAALYRGTQEYREQQQKWRENNRTRYRELNMQSYFRRYRANPEPFKSASREWQRAHPEYRSDPVKRAANVQKCRARKLGSPLIANVDRAAIIARDNGTCYLCGSQPQGRLLEVDHVVPLTRGGEHTAENLRVACRKCNRRKGNKLLSELDWYKP